VINMTRSVAVVMAVVFAACGASRAAAGNPEARLYAYCVGMGVSGVQPRPVAEQAKLLRELGYDGAGFELWLGEERAANLRALDEGGLPLLMAWTTLNVNPAKGAAYDARLPAAIRDLKGRPVTVCVLLQGLPPGDASGVDPAVAALRGLGDVAAEAGVRISIYNHAGDWAQDLPFIVDIVEKARHPSVGYNFNLCHWLKTEGARDARPFLRAHAASLFAVTLNGATAGAKCWTNGLIRPLDEGDVDLASLLATLDGIGYGAPVGLMCYGVPGDARGHLERSMRAWRRLRACGAGTEPATF
jgi:sugar phosphate isomerase/epimerase